MNEETINNLDISNDAPLAIFNSANSFALAQRMAQMLASSDLVPKEFKGKLANCVIALEVAQRTGASPLAVMQNLYIVYGKPSWSSTFIIAALNSCGRFSPLRYDMQGEEGGVNRSCAAWAYDKANNEKLIGPRVSMKMAKAEGWVDKSGSKWQTMPELMLRYRAATFFGRLYAPDVLHGMKTVEEIKDIIDIEATTTANSDQENKDQVATTVKAGTLESMAAAAEQKPPATTEQPSKTTDHKTALAKVRQKLSLYCKGDVKDMRNWLDLQEVKGKPNDCSVGKLLQLDAELTRLIGESQK